MRRDVSYFNQDKTNDIYVYSVTDSKGVTIDKNYTEPVDALGNNIDNSTYMEPVHRNSQKERNIEDMYAKVNKSSPILGKGCKKSSGNKNKGSKHQSRSTKNKGRYSEHETVMHENDAVYTSNQSIVRKDGKYKTVSFKEDDKSSTASSDRISNDSGIQDDDEVRYVSIIEMNEKVEKEQRLNNTERDRPPSISLPENLPDTPQARNSLI